MYCGTKPPQVPRFVFICYGLWPPSSGKFNTNTTLRGQRGFPRLQAKNMGNTRRVGFDMLTCSESLKVTEVFMMQNLQICLEELLEVMETAVTSTEIEIRGVSGK